MNLKILLKTVSNQVSSWLTITLTDIFSTYTGQFITVTGIPSSGKSDFVDQMVVGYNKSMVGRQLLLVLKTNLYIYTPTNLCVRLGVTCHRLDDIGGG